jgi:pimeloyl-ACP methyl ester carboxylesterase
VIGQHRRAIPIPSEDFQERLTRQRPLDRVVPTVRPSDGRHHRLPGVQEWFWPLGNFCSPVGVYSTRGFDVGEKIWKATKLILLGLLGLVVALVGSGLIYRAWYQHQAAKILTITSPNGIDEAMYVPIGGTLQWITIRGQDRNNPVILMVHGGPGVTHSGFAVSFVPWEKDFTVVQWDQPGAGRTFAQERRFPSDLTIESMAKDGVSVAEFLRTHLQKNRIIVLGWSWGSILGVHMVQSRPDLFAAYVGTGQLVNVQAGEAIVYSRVLASARGMGNLRAIRELESTGPPPYKTQTALGTQRKWASILAGDKTPIVKITEFTLLAPRTSLLDAWSSLSGIVASQNHFLGPTMQGEMMKVNLAASHRSFVLPIFVFQGANDDVAPVELAQIYVDSITAPQKQIVLIAGAGHDAIITKTGDFLDLLVQRVRPLAFQPEATTGTTRPLPLALLMRLPGAERQSRFRVGDRPRVIAPNALLAQHEACRGALGLLNAGETNDVGAAW